MQYKNNTFSIKIDLTLSEKLKKDLLEQGFELSKPPYTLFSAKKEGVTCVLYESGALVVQGKDKVSFIEFYLEPQILKSFSFSHPEMGLDLTARIGVDEAGKGDFFGPLCIAALFAEGDGIKKLLEWGVRDSKMISDGAILKIAKDLKIHYPYTIVKLFPQKYNELYKNFKNLNFLLGWAHATAIEELYKKTGSKKAIIDQFADQKIVENAVKKKGLQIELVQRTQGESDIVVAAASILARAAFLEGLKSLSEEVGTTLPKGAASIVLAIGKQLVAKHGNAILEKVAKLHFKTKNEILNSLKKSS